MTVPTPPRTPLVDALNADMASAWNGEEGEDWAARADRFDAASAAFDPALADGARIAAADRVLDVGCGAGISTRAKRCPSVATARSTVAPPASSVWK